MATTTRRERSSKRRTRDRPSTKKRDSEKKRPGRKRSKACRSCGIEFHDAEPRYRGTRNYCVPCGKTKNHSVNEGSDADKTTAAVWNNVRRHARRDGSTWSKDYVRYLIEKDMSEESRVGKRARLKRIDENGSWSTENVELRWEVVVRGDV